MKNKLVILLFGLWGGVMSAQNKADIDETSLLLGMLDYPRERLEGSKYENVVQIFPDGERGSFIKDFFLQTIDKMGVVKLEEVEVGKRGEDIWVKSKPLVDHLNPYLVFFPFTRRWALKKRFRDKDVEEGYINPYIFSPKQQESFVLGFLISKAEINGRDKDLYMEGDYRINFSKSKMFFDIVLSFMENTGFDIRSSEIRQHNYTHGYEVFFATLTLDIPEKYEDYISDRIKLRDKGQ